MKSIILLFIDFCVSILFIAQQFHSVDCAVSILPQLVDASGGNTKFDPRIVGGAKAHEGQVRGIVSLQSRNEHFCGGTWIKYGNKTAILSAAHCFVDDKGLKQKKSLRVIGDIISISKYSRSSSRQIRKVRKIVPHVQYNDTSKDNDIAMIFLYAPFKETSTFGPIEVADRDIVDNQTCEIAGWGHTRESWFKSDDLLIANVSVVSRDICDGPSAYDGRVGKHEFCAGSIAGGVDSCQGDSGGGILSQNKFVGIVSWGDGCGRRNFPGVYTNAFRYRKWIEEKINIPSSATQPTIVVLTIVFAAIFTRSML